ncbi:MAG: response regulator [bacterium]|nr:response regulator [bacterium]
MTRSKVLLPLRLSIPTALLLFTVLLSIWSVQYNGRKTTQKVETNASVALTKLMTRLQITLEHAYSRGDHTLVQREVSGLASELDFKYILLFDDKGQILASSRIAHIGHSFITKLESLSEQERKMVFSHLSEVRRTQAGHVYLGELKQYLVGIYPIILGNQPQKLREPIRGFLLIFQDLKSQKDEALQAVYRQVLQFSVILGLLIIGLGIFFDQIVSRRINRIVAVTHQVGRGDYSVRTGLGGRDEIGLLAAAVDEMVQSRQGAEEMLHKLNRAVEQSPVSVVVTDLAANIEYINPRVTEITGYQPEELLGKNPRLFKSGHHDNAFYQKIWNELTAGRQWRGELLNRKKNGEHFWESTTLSPVFDDSGRIINYLGVKEDITLQKQRDDELQKARFEAEAANLAKTNFLATMSHELRTPMNGILGMGQILEGDEQDPEKRAMLQVMLSSSRALVQVLDEILDISRIEARQLNSEQKLVDLHNLLENLQQMFSASAQAKHLDWIVETHRIGTPRVMGDASLITKVLSNLVGNAIKFTPQGSVRLTARNVTYRGGAGMRFEVADTGVGIPASKLGLIFKSFTQADSSSTRRFGGVGLGLSITQSLVRLMGGEVGVQSREGQGSLFWFEIPAPPEDNPHSASKVFDPSYQPPTQAAQPSLNEFHGVLPKNRETPEPALPKPKLKQKAQHSERKHRILVVEDDSINASVIRRILTLNHYQVLEAGNGRIALELLEHESVDLILMDCLMPVLDGFKATRLIRERETKNQQPRLPIIAVTAKAMDEDKALCLDAGMDDYLTKPIEMRQLIKSIQNFLGEP